MEIYEGDEMTTKAPGESGEGPCAEIEIIRVDGRARLRVGTGP